jgi:hypothetical protein
MPEPREHVPQRGRHAQIAGTSATRYQVMLPGMKQRMLTPR